MRSRFTVVEQAYHQVEGREPTVSGVRASFEVKSGEDPYRRSMDVAGEWRLVDVGWAAEGGSLSALVVYNEIKKFTLNPTPEQKALADGAVLEVRHVGDTSSFLVKPGDQLRCLPTGQVEVRVKNGELVRVSTTAVPG